MTLAYVGLGANIGDPRRHMQDAIGDLMALPDTQFVVASSLYRSAPVGHTDQPDFLNAVVQLDTELAPGALLDRLQDIEHKHGRERSFPGAPRSLDLDLLLYGDTVLATPRLTLPHPRMHERAFVLRPLTEITPDAVVPGRGTAASLLKGCRDQIAARVA